MMLGAASVGQAVFERASLEMASVRAITVGTACILCQHGYAHDRVISAFMALCATNAASMSCIGHVESKQEGYKTGGNIGCGGLKK
jgi:hypothetical protein